MLPLNPPARPRSPGYPERSQALADDDSRRRLHGILAASVLGLALGGCGGQAAPQPLGGRTAPPPQPAQAQPLPGGAPAQPQPLGGKPAVPQAAEPAAPLRGDVMTPVPPAQVEPAPKAEAPKVKAKQEVKRDAQEEAVPLPMMGVMVAPQAPPRDPA